MLRLLVFGLLLGKLSDALPHSLAEDKLTVSASASSPTAAVENSAEYNPSFNPLSAVLDVHCILVT
jgi:hypothetical protein